MSSSAGSEGSGSSAGSVPASSTAEQPSLGATAEQPDPGGAAGQEMDWAEPGQRRVGRAAPDAAQAARDVQQELRDRGRELREISRERARELRELAREQRELAREQARELRELARAQRADALGLRVPGMGRAGRAGAASNGGSAGVGIDGSPVGDERSTRERVLDVALDIFIEQGYDKASLREIAERMGFTKAALYYHFPSKADMLLALHERMHSIIDEPVSLLGDGIVTVAMWEQFLDACISALQGNQKLFQMHRINQAALAGVHSDGHDGSHQELEEQAMRIFAEPSLSPEDRLRMAAAFAVSFFTPFITSGLFSNKGDDFLPTGLREIVHRVLHPEAAKRQTESQVGAAKRDEETETAADKREAEKPAP